MTSWGDKVEEGVHSVVAEAWVTLDAGLFSENIVILSLDVASDFTKAKQFQHFKLRSHRERTHVNSLSILSPNPGVSTIVREMRTPSSSSSEENGQTRSPQGRDRRLLTDIDGLDPDALFDVSSIWVIADLVCDDFRLAKRVDKSRASRARGT